MASRFLFTSYCLLIIPLAALGFHQQCVTKQYRYHYHDCHLANSAASLSSSSKDAEIESISTRTRTRSEEGASIRPTTVVEQCYKAWNQRDMEKAASYFSKDFSYDDGQYLGSITQNKSKLQRRFQVVADALPPKSVMVVDDIAVCQTSGNIGTRWHVERAEDGSSVPLTRGCSFYTVDQGSGLIQTGFKVSEMVVKPSKRASNGLVSSASRFMESSNKGIDMVAAVSSSQGIGIGIGRPSTTASIQDDDDDSSSPSSSSSVIEGYFQAWNDRNMEGALDYFIEDCVYEVEDPVFVDKFCGKEALREHLVKNAGVLPSACQIILDDLAVDRSNGKFGVKWHLEVSGFAIPNLRGCSMYTMDCELGLLKSGFDITEAPVKVPDLAQGFVSSLVSKIGLFQ